MSLQVTLTGNISYPSITSYPGVTINADGSWHQISVPNYAIGSSYDPGPVYVYLQTVPPSRNDLVSFYIDDFQLTYLPPPTIQTSLPSVYQTLSYRWGFTLSYASRSDWIVLKDSFFTGSSVYGNYVD